MNQPFTGIEGIDSIFAGCESSLKISSPGGISFVKHQEINLLNQSCSI